MSDKIIDIFTAVKSGDSEQVRAAIANGADVNARYVPGPEVDDRTWYILGEDRDAEQTPLHYAKNADIAHMLIEHGADVNARTKLGQTPLHYANNPDVARVLIEHGADVNARDSRKAGVAHEWNWDWSSGDGYDGRTPLHCANADVARVLIENGADVNAGTKWKQTPLHFASYEGNADIARVLLEHGADANARDIYGRTPLHFATEKKIARVLIKYGADVDAYDNTGETPEILWEMQL